MPQEKAAKTDNKRITPKAELGANYILHLMATARIVFNSDYADKYETTIEKNDLEVLKKNKNRLTAFRSGSGEDSMADVVIGFPIAFALKSRSDYEKYFRILDDCFDSNSMSEFQKAYSEEISRFQKMIPFDTEELIGFAVYRELISEIGQIIINNFQRYRTDVWPQEMEKMASVLDKLCACFESTDHIFRWENLTGRVFKTDYFIPSLCSAIKGGPDANSIGYDRVLFYYGRPFDELVQFVSHEVGTHILIDDYFNLLKTGKYDAGTLFMAYECLAMFYNKRILEVDETTYRLNEFPDIEFCRIYDEISDKNPDLTPPELLVKGLEVYQSQNR